MPSVRFKVYRVPDKAKDGQELVYYHKKSRKSIWMRSQRNTWAGGSGDNLGSINKGWVELRKIMKEIFGRELDTHHEFLAYLEKGNVDKRLKDHMVKYAFEGIKNRDFSKYPKSETEKYFETHEHMNGSGNRGIDWPGSSEMRETAKLYYDILHTEEILELDEEFVMDAPFENETKEYYKEHKDGQTTGSSK
jgi:hypothetical protein